MVNDNIENGSLFGSETVISRPPSSYGWIRMNDHTMGDHAITDKGLGSCVSYPIIDDRNFNFIII